MRDFSRFGVGKTALVVVLSFMLAMGSLPSESLGALHAYAGEQTQPEGDSVRVSPGETSGEASKDAVGTATGDRIAQDVPLVPSNPPASGATELKPSTPVAEGADNTSSNTTSSSGHVQADAPLAPEGLAVKPVAGTIVQDGLVFEVESGGAAVALVGWRGEAPSGVLSVPDAVATGGETFPVRKIGRGGGFSAELPLSQ